MPSPTKQQYHVDAMLTNISIAYIQRTETFVADKVFPVVPVRKQSDRYFLYKKEDWFRDEAEERRRAAESAGGGYEIDNTPDYACKLYAYHKDVTNEDRVNSDVPLNPDRDATLWLTQKLLLKREITWATKYFAADLWANEYVGAASDPGDGEVLQWDVATSDPIGDVADAQIAIQSTTGFRPMTLLLGAHVYKVLRNHDDIIERIKYSGSPGNPAVTNTRALATVFDVDKVVVAHAVKNVAAKGATEDTDFILGKHALLVYSAPQPAIMQPSAGYIFAWSGLLGAGAYGMRVSRIPAPLLGQGTERIEGEMAFDCKLVADDMGSFFNGIVT